MTPDVVCIGSVHWDLIGRPDPRLVDRIPRGADLPGRIVRVPGGVALNVAVTLRRFGMTPTLLGAVGVDADGEALVASCASIGLVTDHLTRTQGPTDRYIAIEAPDGLLGAIADGRSLEAAGAAILGPLTDGRLSKPWRGPVALDSNVTASLLRQIAEADILAHADLRIAPASWAKADRLRVALGHPSAVLYLNLEEARVVLDRPLADAREAAVALVEAGAARALVTDGVQPVFDATAARVLDAAPEPVEVVRSLGAGDAFMAAHIAGEARSLGADDALRGAIAAASAHVAGRT